MAAKGIRGYPTFHFYKNGALVESFSGADENRLTRIVDQYTAVVEKPNPYRHFPLKSKEVVTYTKIKYDKVIGGLERMNADLIEGEPLSPSEMEEVKGICTMLEDKLKFHATSLSPSQISIIDRMLFKWSIEQSIPALNLLRMLLQHPASASHYAKRFANVSDPLLDRICHIATTADTAAAQMLALRTITNVFCRRVVTKAVVGRVEELLSSISALADNSNVKVLLDFLSVLVNFAILSGEG